jgi:hypothetical protein
MRSTRWQRRPILFNADKRAKNWRVRCAITAMASLALVDALADVPRTAILPPPRSAPRAVAVRAIAAADPLAAYRLAHALRKGKSDAVLNALMDAPFDTLTRIWRLLPETLQHAVLGDLDALLRDVAAPGRGDDLAQALQDWGADDPLPLLALRMLIGDSEERAGVGHIGAGAAPRRGCSAAAAHARRRTHAVGA